VPLDRTITELTTDLNGLLIDGVGDAVQGGLAWVRTPMRAALMLYVIITAANMVAGHASGRSLIMAAVRATCIAAILQSGNFVTYVQELFLTTLPNELAGAFHAEAITAGAAVQFDALRDAIQHAAAIALEQASGLLGIGNRAVIHLFSAFGQAGIFLMWLFWYVPRVLIAIVIPLGPFLIPFFLYRATRGFGESWAGKLVSLTCFQVAAAVLVKLLLTSINRRISAMEANAGEGVDQMIATLASMSGVMWFGAILMLVLPAAISIGSGVGASATTIVSYTVSAVGAPFRVMAGRFR
jgi:type IV secretory pathway VirB6-like protein